MRLKIFKWVIFAALLLECQNLFSFIGYFDEETDYSFFRGLQPMTYILIICFFLAKTKIQGAFQWVYLIFVIFISVFNLRTGRDADMKMMTTGFILPIFLSNYLKNFKDIKFKLIAQKGIVVFYCVVCGLALVERLLSVVILARNIEASEDGFRSWALCGHPLSNALLISIAMSFILLSDMKRKLELFFLGMVALLCFNTRSSMMYWAAAAVLYYFYLVKSHNKLSKKYFYYLMFAGVAVTVLMVCFGFGNRIITMGAYDESSAAVRVAIFDIFNYYPLSDFKFGYPAKDIQMIQYRSGIYGMIIENYWLLFLLRFGYIFTSILSVLMLTFMWKNLKGRKLFDILYILAAFLMVSSTNNSLSTPNNGILLFFVLCAFAFSNQTLPSKYSNK